MWIAPPPEKSEINNIPVYLPEILTDEKDVFIIICSRFGMNDIITRLDSMGFQEGKDYVPYTLFWFADEIESSIVFDLSDELPYETMLFPVGFAPWRNDDEFAKTLKIVDNHSLLGNVKLFFLWQAVAEAAKLQDGVFVEVGTWRGGSGCTIAKKLKILGKSNTVYLCDTFKGVVKASYLDNCYVGGEHSDTDIETVQQLAERLSVDNIVILQGVFPDDTHDAIAGKKIAFVHIDVDVYQSAKDVFDFVWPCMLPGGIIIFDDYGAHTTQGVKKIVDEIRDESDRIFMSNISGQGILIKKA